MNVETPEFIRLAVVLDINEGKAVGPAVLEMKEGKVGVGAEEDTTEEDCAGSVFVELVETAGEVTADIGTVS